MGGEWVTVTEDMATFEVVGDSTGVQMSAMDVGAPVALIDHVGEAKVKTHSTRKQRWNLRYSGAHTGNIKLKFAYNPALLPAGYDANQLVIYHSNNGVWEKLPCKVNPATNVIEAITSSLSPFMLGVNDVVVKPDVSLSVDIPGSLNVSWPDSFTGWTLQESPDLNPTSWFDSSRVITTVNSTSSVTVPLSSGSRFFRLVKP